MKDYFKFETEQRTWCKKVSPTNVQIHRWYWIKDNILNPIREHVKAPVHLTSCLRDEKEYKRLLSAGYYPSATSDHFGGEPVILTDQEDINKYGKIYSYSTFACDITGNFDYKNLCRDLYLTINDMITKDDYRYVHHLTEFGVEQLILEAQERNGKTINWIHIAAPLEAFYSLNESKIIRKVRKSPRFQKSVNGKYQLMSFFAD